MRLAQYSLALQIRKHLVADSESLDMGCGGVNFKVPN